MTPLKHPFALLSGLAFSLGVFVLWSTSSGIAEEANSVAFFPDIEQGSYYDLPVLSMVRKGVVKGYDDGRFDPHGFVTRGQVVTMLHRYDREVVHPLRQQIAKLRELLELGRCGDAKVQVGEECDDGNLVSNDGCSGSCKIE